MHKLDDLEKAVSFFEERIEDYNIIEINKRNYGSLEEYRKYVMNINLSSYKNLTDSSLKLLYEYTILLFYGLTKKEILEMSYEECVTFIFLFIERN